MKRATVTLVTLAATVAALLATLIATGVSTATAASGCVLLPKSKLAPYLLSPCEGAAVVERSAVTFTVYDANALAAKSARDHPYLNLQTTHTVQDGHLAASTDGTGIFTQLMPVKGHPREWTFVSRPQSYRSWWDNHAGTDYAQIQQIDPAAGTAGILYSPIVTIHVRAR